MACERQQQKDDTDTTSLIARKSMCLLLNVVSSASHSTSVEAIIQLAAPSMSSNDFTNKRLQRGGHTYLFTYLLTYTNTTHNDFGCGRQDTRTSREGDLGDRDFAAWTIGDIDYMD
eukprot:1053422-Amphidinium_carterae.1